MNDSDLYVAKKLKYYRNKFGWPLKTLSSDLDISLQQLQRYESGANKISAGLLFKLSKIFKIDIMCFFDGFEKQELDENNSYKILLIEDNSDDEFFFRKSVGDFDKNIEIYVLRDGLEVIKYFRELQDKPVRFFSKPDIIFIDLNLPSLSGFDVMNDLKKRPILNGVPLIILTGSINDEDVTKSYAMHASGFIKKSFTYDDYNQQICRALNYWINAASLPSQQDKKNEED